MDTRILTIEDNPEIADLLRMHLSEAGYRVEIAGDGETGLEMALRGDYALIILDLMLPGMDGFRVCQRLRAQGKTMSILMLTAKSEEIDKVLGLELGADDYLTKPFSIRELIARVNAILRRSRGFPEFGPSSRTLEFDRLTIHPDKRRVTLGGDPVELTLKEFDLLALFAANPGVPFTREQLLDRVWGYSYSGYEHTVNSHINRLRVKIENDPSHPRYIRTVWGYGYRFAELEELDS